jgi:hypothetical protein
MTLTGCDIGPGCDDDPELRKALGRLHCALDVMLVCARWYAGWCAPAGTLAGVRPLVRCLAVERSTLGRNDAGARRPC